MAVHLKFLGEAFKATRNLALLAGPRRSCPAQSGRLWLHLSLPFLSGALSSPSSWNIPDSLLLWELREAVFLCLEDSSPPSLLHRRSNTHSSFGSLPSLPRSPRAARLRGVGLVGQTVLSLSKGSQ